MKQGLKFISAKLIEIIKTDKTNARFSLTSSYFFSELIRIEFL